MRPLDDEGLPENAEEEEDDPTDPSHRDYDLSTSAPYEFDGPADAKPWFLRRGFILLIGAVLIFSLILPLLVI
ncbi:MAG TPA: hypothetical protein VFY10_06780 [Dehalococcoidia bacterium]|nr:hypothetical protein [Dehalococcoidia bacterium]